MRFFGYTLFVSGTILFGLMHLAIAIYLPNLGGWSDPPGLIATVLSDITGWVPYILSITFMVIGVILVVYDSKWWAKHMNEVSVSEKESVESPEED